MLCVSGAFLSERSEGSELSFPFPFPSSSLSIDSMLWVAR